MDNSSVYEQKRFLVRVQTGPRNFTVETQTPDDAEFLQRAIECYQNFDNVVNHMDFAIRKLREVAPSGAQ